MTNHQLKAISTALIVIITVSAAVGCLSDTSDSNNDNSLIGIWIYEEEGETGRLRFNTDGSFSFKAPGATTTVSGNYKIHNGSFTLYFEGGIDSTYSYVLNNNALQLTFPSGATKTFHRK